MTQDPHILLAVPRLLADGLWTGPMTLRIADGRIAAIAEGVLPGADTLCGGALTAGLLDLHNNGAFGVDFATADAPQWSAVLAGFAACGVTGVLATVITQPIPAIHAAMLQARSAAGLEAPVARVLGVHLEGPYLLPARRGAHLAEWLQEPSPAALDTLLGDAATRTMLRLVTLAPELPHALDAIRRLVAAGIIVSLGHTDADAAQVGAAADAGATMVTHLFNAMRPFSHRDPAVPGAALCDPRLFCGLIVDGVHVDPLACRLALQAAPGRIVAVTDSIVVAGMAEGTTLEFGGAPVTVGADGAGRRADGTLSGAGITLDAGVRRMIAAGLDPAVVLHAATAAPAQVLGRHDLGRIAPGALADLVWWDEDWRPRRVWIGGREVHHGG